MHAWTNVAKFSIMIVQCTVHRAIESVYAYTKIYISHVVTCDRWKVLESFSKNLRQSHSLIPVNLSAKEQQM